MQPFRNVYLYFALVLPLAIFAVLFTATFWTFVRELSPTGLREGRATEDT